MQAGAIVVSQLILIDYLFIRKGFHTCIPLDAQAATEDNLYNDPNIAIGVADLVKDKGEKTGYYVVQVEIVSSE